MTDPMTPDREQWRQQIADAASKAHSAWNADVPGSDGPLHEYIADAVLPVLDAAVAAAVRRALDDAGRTLSAIEEDSHAAAVVQYLATPYTDDTAVASPARDQGPALPLLHQACSCGHFRNWHWNGTETVGCRDCECTEFRYAREHGHSCRNCEGVDPDNCLMNPAREQAPEATR